jgi:3-oxoacyl-[acyl-carrier protein] reductase
MDEGKVTLITGTSKGIGYALSTHMLARGGRVIGFSRSDATIVHERYRHFSLDIGDEKAVAKAFGEIRVEFDRLDVLVNNAGVLTSQFALLTPTSSVETMLRTNVLGGFLVSKEAAKLMMKKRYGRIVSISSMAVPLSPSGDAMYSATKAALAQFTRVFAKEVAPYGITANVLGITAIETDMIANIPKEALATIINQLPIKRHVSMEEIFHALDFFADESSSAITGQTLYVGGVF